MSSTLQLIGLGVDDMYIVLLALKKEKDFTEKGFLRGMQEVVVPVSMTSFVNASMFAVMNSKFWFPIFFFVLSFQYNNSNFFFATFQFLMYRLST